MTEANPPAGAENQQTQAEAVTQQTAPAPASGVKPDIKDRLARQERKLRQEAETAVAKAREEAIAEFREEHGLDDESLTQWQQRDRAASEMRALKAQATKATNEAAQWKAKYESAFSFLDSTLRTDAIMQEAVRQGSNDPELVAVVLQPATRLLEKDGKYSVAVVDEKGEATEGNVTELVTTLLAKKPHLAAPSNRAAGAGSRLSQHRTADEAGQFSSRDVRLAHLAKVLGG